MSANENIRGWPATSDWKKCYAVSIIAEVESLVVASAQSIVVRDVEEYQRKLSGATEQSIVSNGSTNAGEVGKVYPAAPPGSRPDSRNE